MHPILKILIVLALPALLAGCVSLGGEITIDDTPLGPVMKIGQTLGTPGAVCAYDINGENPDCVAGNGAATEIASSAIEATGMIASSVLAPVSTVTAIAVANVNNATTLKK